MNKAKIFKLITVLIAIVVAVLLYVVLIGRNKDDEPIVTPPVEYMSVVVAAEDIPAKTVITEEHLTTKEFPVTMLNPGTQTDVAAVVGKLSRLNIIAGEIVTTNNLTVEGDRSANSLALIIEPGMRAFTISVSSLTSVNNMIRPGDFVDVIAYISMQIEDTNPIYALNGQDHEMVSMTLLENIEVLAVDQVISDEYSPNAYSALTLMVTPEQANRLDYASYNGTLRVLLRTPLDTAEQGANKISERDLTPGATE